MSQSAEKYYSPEEYLALEEKAGRKSEYYNGKIYLMSGGSNNHSRICVNTIVELSHGLDDTRCEIFESNMRILVEASDFYTYPDVAVTCGEAEFMAGRSDTLLNPIMLVEVLSPSTRIYDRGEKFLFYRSIKSLQIYLLVEQLKVYVECYQKQADETWLLKIYDSPDQEIELAAVGVKITVGKLYKHVKFPNKQPKKPREKIIPHPSIEN